VGVPEVVSFQRTRDADVLELVFFDARPWSELPRSGRRDVAALGRLLMILARCSWRGVAHNDLRAENVLVDERGTCFLIDFDQATLCSRTSALLANFIGIGLGKGATKVTLSKLLIEKMLPTPAVDGLRRLKLKADRKRWRRLPRLPENASPRLRKLLDAWRTAQQSDANAPGMGLAYYSLREEDVLLPGERPWDERWEVLRNVTDFSGKRILELGCNMGLLSTHLLREEKAASAMGVDYEPGILQSAKLVAEAYEVSPLFKQVNFDADLGWEEDLAAFKPDVVFALNVYNWLSDKERFLRFLARFPVVILEGHDSYEIEVERLTRYAPGECRLVSISERQRPLLICTRS